METPTSYGFDLDAGETITRVIRRHPITLVPPIAGSAGLFVLALFLVFAEARFPANIPFPPMLILAMAGVMVVLAIIFFLVGLFVYHRNVLIFTNEHLV